MWSAMTIVVIGSVGKVFRSDKADFLPIPQL